MKTISAAFLLVFFLKTNLVFSQNHSKMNLKDQHPKEKGVETKMMFPAKDGKVISLQILKNQQLKEHTTPIPALLVCVKGKAVFEDEKGVSISLSSGDYVNIEPNVKHWVTAKTDANLLLIK